MAGKPVGRTHGEVEEADAHRHKREHAPDYQRPSETAAERQNRDTRHERRHGVPVLPPAAAMEVPELRAELQRRGKDTSGLKLFLVARLKAARREDSVGSEGAAAGAAEAATSRAATAAAAAAATEAAPATEAAVTAVEAAKAVEVAEAEAVEMAEAAEAAEVVVTMEAEAPTAAEGAAASSSAQMEDEATLDLHGEMEEMPLTQQCPICLEPAGSNGGTVVELACGHCLPVCSACHGDLVSRARPTNAPPPRMLRGGPAAGPQRTCPE